jgi:GAF domain-containing protein
MSMIDPKVKQILDALLTHAEKVIDGIDCFYVALYNQVTVALDFPLAVKKSGEGLKRLETGDGRWVSRPYRPGEFLPDYIFADSQPVLIEEKFRDWIDKKDLKYYEGELPLSWLGVPLMARGRAIGAIVVESYEREHAYGTRTLALLSAMGNRTAGALANARLVRNLRAVNEVGQRMTSGIRLSTEGILELIYQQASQLMDTRDMYIALYDAGQQRLSFPLAMLDGKPIQWPSRKVDVEDKSKGGLTEEVIRAKSPVRPLNVEEWYKKRKLKPPVLPLPKAWLGVPMIIEDTVLGIIALQNDEVENLYGPDDQEVLETMARQAAVALANARLVESLRAVNEVGQRLTSGIRLSVDGILELIHQQASRLMDTRNMYVALYDAVQQQLSFPLATYGGKREQWPSRNVDIEDESKGGLTEEVIRTKCPLCPPNVEAWFEERDLTPPVLPVSKSWLGVPMMIGDRVLGVIAVQNDDVENLYGQDAEAVLQTMAGQAAVAIENAQLLDQVADRERALVLTSVAADFVHRMNNLAGTIPNWVALARRQLDPNNKRDQQVIQYLERIADDSKVLLREARRLRDPLPEPEEIDVKELMDSIIAQMELRASPEIDFILQSERDLGQVWAVRTQLSDAVFNVIDNSVKAITGDGQVSVRLTRDTARPNEFIRIEIVDTGCGMPVDRLATIFELGKTYRSDSEGTGYGLWRTRNIVEDIGGFVSVESIEGKGTTFSITLPVVSSAKLVNSEIAQ